MKRTLHILLITTCLLPLLSSAREETPEERKQRITRKYLRERTTILQSDSMVVPEESAEDLQVLDSERFKEADVDLLRQEPGTMLPLPPQPRRPLPTAEERNWLLAADPETGDSEALDETKKGAGDWTSWNTERETSPYRQTESRFDRRNYDASSQQSSGIYDPKRQGSFNPRAPTPFSSDGFQDRNSPFGEQNGLPGRTPSATSGLDFSRDPIQVQDPNVFPGRLYTPFSRDTENSSDRSFGSGTQQRSGSTPYASPYQSQRNQQQQGTYGTSQQEFQKQDPYQKWKENNPTRFDPTRDDAFINDVMPKTRR